MSCRRGFRPPVVGVRHRSMCCVGLALMEPLAWRRHPSGVGRAAIGRGVTWCSGVFLLLGGCVFVPLAFDTSTLQVFPASRTCQPHCLGMTSWAHLPWASEIFFRLGSGMPEQTLSQPFSRFKAQKQRNLLDMAGGIPGSVKPDRS